MADPIETTLSIQQAVLDQADSLAQQLNLSRDQLFEMAVQAFIQTHQSQTSPRKVNQGDIFWVQPGAPGDVEPGIPHPHLVVQTNVFNHSRLNTVVVCALTSNLKRVNMPGNVLLDTDEANLPRQSVVEVSKLLIFSTVYKTQLGDYIGSLSAQRVDQVLAGLRFLQTSFFGDG